MDLYTTQEKLNAEANAIVLDKDFVPVEINKTLISNDAYAIVDLLDKLIKATEVLAIK